MVKKYKNVKKKSKNFEEKKIIAEKKCSPVPVSESREGGTLSVTNERTKEKQTEVYLSNIGFKIFFKAKDI